MTTQVSDCAVYQRLNSQDCRRSVVLGDWPLQLCVSDGVADTEEVVYNLAIDNSAVVFIEIRLCQVNKWFNSQTIQIVA